MHEVANGLRRPNPLWGPGAIALAGLSLSIGWGIRGNYSQVTGAMIPGALAAIAVCVASGREDWRQRVAYFACFGALGWAFGASMSYIHVLAYSQSGHEASQFYGYWGLFLIGFLWAALGGAGTALPVSFDSKSLCEMFRPLSLLLALWILLYFVERPLTKIVQTHVDTPYGAIGGSQRHESVLYWFDSSWLSVFVTLIGILVFDLVDRRFSNSLVLPVFAAVGAFLGHFAEQALVRLHWSEGVYNLLVHVQGDPTRFDRSRLLTNWPELFLIGKAYLGLAVGLAIGIAAYFAIYGRFRRGSSLFLHMALGWFAGFLLLPVLLDVRMTPPRGDNWAGVLGVYGGVLIYSIRNKLWPIVAASLVAGTIGGIGLSGTACLEMLLESFGNPNLPALAADWTRWQAEAVTTYTYPPEFMTHVVPDAAWQFWHEANWHSFLEQGYGFVNGIGVIVAMALLLNRIGPLKNEMQRQHWCEIVAVTITLPILLYANIQQNVANWVGANPGAMPANMRMPLVGFSLSAWGWFNIFFGTAALAMVILLRIHTRRRLALLDQSWLARGQFLFLVMLWAFVLGNFAKALTGFTEQRLATEGIITFNAVLATMLVLLVPASQSPSELSDEDSPAATADFRPLIRRSLIALAATALLLPPLETVCTRAVYGDAPTYQVGKFGPHTRFGPRAYWSHRPLLKGSQHW